MQLEEQVATEVAAEDEQVGEGLTTPDVDTGKKPAGKATDTKPTEVTPPELDLSKVDLGEILEKRPDLRDYFLNKDEGVKRAIQSAKDVEIAREKRRLSSEARQREEERSQQEEIAERRRLLDAEDYEALGKLEAEKESQNEILRTANKAVNARYLGEVRKSAEFAPLGEDRIEQIIADATAANGTLLDVTSRLSEARRGLDVEIAAREANKDIDVRVREAVEAAMASAGVQKRTDEPGASESVSGGTKPREQTGEMTHEKASEMYGNGEMSWEEFQPFRDAHDKQRRNR